MNPTEAKVEQILNSTDDNLQPLEEENKDAPTNSNDTNDSDAPNSSDPSQTSGSDSNQPTDPPANEPENTENNEGFTANEVADEPETTPEEPEEPVNETPSNLDPETQYIVDNLPEIQTTILVDGKPQAVAVKSWTQLPNDVEFASKRDEIAFINALTAQENKAQQLQAQFRSNQQEQQNNDFEVREAQGIRNDITKLQQDKLIPNFQSKPDDPGFNEDPATKEVQKVLDFMNQKNQEYLDNYNKGGQYRHIGFEEAFYMMPDTRQKQAQAQTQTQEDTERKQRAQKVSPTTGISNLQIKKPTVPRGTTMQQIADYYENIL